MSATSKPAGGYEAAGPSACAPAPHANRLLAQLPEADAALLL
jgi:hypothetical protein